MLIDKFEGEYWFLSNYFDCPIIFQNIKYKNAEAAYQAQKLSDMNERDREYIFSNMTADDARHYAHKFIAVRPDWDEVKLTVMRQVVMAKFYQNKDLCKKLINTGNATLAEGNWWGDRFWGMIEENGCLVGENWLGRILMEVRDELRKEKEKVVY